MSEEKSKQAPAKPTSLIPKSTKKQKEVIVIFSIRTQIIALVIALLIAVVVIVYRVTLRDEKEALTKQMELRGSALTQSFAASSHDVLSGIFMDMGLEADKKSSYDKIDFFELQERLTVPKMLEQEDVIYAYIVNPFNQIIAHSDKNISELSELKLPPGVKKYKDLYKKGELVKPIFQKYTMDYKSTITGKMIEKGGVIDISFPLKIARETKSIKTYAGEVHLGMSDEGILKTISDAKLALFISSPIKKLVAAMKKVSKGDLNQSVRIRRKDEIGVLGASFNSMTEGLREKEQIKSTFGKFVSDEVAETVLAEGSLKLGGEYKEVTVFFSDIRSFTTISEKMEPHELIAMLNEYYNIMVDIIIKYHGVIDKYVGDEIMALWGAYTKRENDIELCVRAALEQLKALETWNDKRRAKGEPDIRIGIGINTGQVVSGKMGAEQRLEYTVIGDTVNTAERLCSNASKKGLHSLIVTEYTYNAIRDIVVAKEGGEIPLKGKEEEVKVYEIYDIKDEYKEFKLE